jgi:hypothetical protein
MCFDPLLFHSPMVQLRFEQATQSYFELVALLTWSFCLCALLKIEPVVHRKVLKVLGFKLVKTDLRATVEPTGWEKTDAQ